MAWERLRRKCRSRIISPCSRTFPARCCPRLPGIAHDCPLKKCRKPWWPRNTAVDLAALDVSRAPLRDSPAVRLSKRIMNQGLSWRAAQAGANSEVFTNHETRVTNHGLFFAVGAPGWATGNRRPDHCARRQAAVSRFIVVHHCSRLFTIVRHCSRKNIVWSQCPRAARSLLRWAFSRGMARLSRGLRGGGVGGESVSLHRPPFSVGLATSIARRAAPAAANTNEPMLRKGNVPACISRQPTRRSECESRVTNHEITAFLDISPGANLASANGFHESRDTNHGFSIALTGGVDTLRWEA